jgi:putative oxidoreductase
MPSPGPTIIRVAVGILFAAHGAQKLFGVGGGGLTATASSFDQLGLVPAWPLAILVGVVEFAGGLMLVAGAYTIFAAAPLMATLLVAMWKVHLPNGFFINWSNAPGVGHGYEMSLILLAALASLMVTGPGALSFDRYRAREAETQAAGRARLRMGKV